MAIGKGDWQASIDVTGADEINDLMCAFNQIRRLREKDHRSTETVEHLNDDLRAQLAKVKQLREQLYEENATLRKELREIQVATENIGENGSLREVMEQTRKLAGLPVTVLITGDSGTGKELLALYLHKAGPGQNTPLITVNCAAPPANLIESELFGHEKGTFTGAISQKKGKFELAHGGTLFLDEIGELPLEAQAKLLRALQQNEIQRVGSE